MTTPEVQTNSLPRTALALAMLTTGALLLEVTLVRVLSVALWYPVAYVVLATAMLGFGAAAVCVATLPKLRRSPAQDVMVRAAWGFATSAAAGYPLWNLLPVDPMGLGHDPSQAPMLAMWLVLICLPFFFAGIFVAKLFASERRRAAFLYGADLGGSAVGATLFVALVPNLGGPGTLLIAAALGATAALLLLKAPVATRLAAAAIVTAVVALAPVIETWVPLRVSENKMMGSQQAEGRTRNTQWSSHATIDVVGSPEGAYLVIDGGTSLTLAPKIGHHEGPAEAAGLRALPFALTEADSTLVVGSGGGLEVQAAVAAGSKRILVLEVNDGINDLVRGPLAQLTGGLFDYPQVELRTAAARSYLASHEERFDAIVSFHTISDAATGGGGMALAENYLLTTEAMGLLLERLTPDGVLVISRPEQQLGRLAATLAEAWTSSEPIGEHVAVVSHDEDAPSFLAALVLSRRALSEDQQARVRSLTPGNVLYLPDGSGSQQAYFSTALAWPEVGHTDAPREAARALGYTAVDMQPCTDARPFFNLERSWSSLHLRDAFAVLGAGSNSQLELEALPVSQIALLLLLLEVLLVAGAILGLPLVRLKKIGFCNGEVWRLALYFGAVGLAFMTLEVTLIQMLTRLVGHPSWSIVAVLATLLAATGLGSLWLAGRHDMSPRKGAWLAAAASTAVAVFLPTLIDAGSSHSLGARLLFTAACVLPLGLLLGIPFAAGLSRLRQEVAVGWAWANNSVFSVLGSIAALVLGSTIGLPATALAAALAYALATLVAPSGRAPKATS